MRTTHEYYRLRNHTVQIVSSGGMFITCLFDLQEPEPKVLSADVFDSLAEASARATSLIMDNARIESVLESNAN